MPSIPNFSEPELHRLKEMLTQRYKKDVEIELTKCDLYPNQDGGEALSCPTVFWHENGTNFVVYKTEMLQYISQFFYTPHEQYGTGIDNYNNLDDCVSAVLQSHSEHQRDRDSPGSDLGDKN